MSAGSLGTSLNLSYFFNTGVSTFSIYLLHTSIFLALMSDNLSVFRLYSALFQSNCSLMWDLLRYVNIASLFVIYLWHYEYIINNGIEIFMYLNFWLCFWADLVILFFNDWRAWIIMWVYFWDDLSYWCYVRHMP